MCHQLRIQGGGKGGMATPVTVETGHKKEVRHQRTFIFDFSWHPPSDQSRTDAGHMKLFLKLLPSIRSRMIRGGSGDRKH